MTNALSTPPTAFSSNANGVANGTYTLLHTLVFGVNPPDECFLQFTMQPNTTPSGNKQAVFFVSGSQDGSVYADAPSSATERNANQIGTMGLPDTSARTSKPLPLSPWFAGVLPWAVRIYVKNDCGVAFSASGNSGTYQTETSS